MKSIIQPLVLTMALVFAPIKASFAGLEPFLGEIDLFAGNFAPRSYAFCEGQILSIKDNVSLYSILGTQYGGNGKTTFALPDLRNTEKSLKGVRYIIALWGISPRPRRR